MRNSSGSRGVPNGMQARLVGLAFSFNRASLIGRCGRTAAGTEDAVGCESAILDVEGKRDSARCGSMCVWLCFG